MREFELTLILANLTAIVWITAAPRRASLGRVALPALLLGVLFLQVMIEGYRWQMVPAYLALLATAVVSALRENKLGARGLGGIAAALMASSLAAVIYPVFQLPAPSGPYRIGTVSYHLVDTERREIYGARPGGPREVMIQVWYPAAAGPPVAAERYRDPALTAAKFNYLKLVKTHTFRNIPIAPSSAPFPVILFSPSWHGLRNQEMAVVEDLVSHGFVVVGVDHPYGSGVVVFPDGRKVWARNVNFMDTSSEATTRASFRVDDQEVRIRALDLVFVLRQLIPINQADSFGILTGRLDLARVGILGYSFGGAVAVEACWLDPAFRAAVDLDGALFGEGAKGIAQPLMVMTDSAAPPPAADLASPRAPRRRWAEFLAEQSRLLHDDFQLHGGYLVEIAGIAHANFADDALISPVRWLSGGGRIDRYRALAIVRDMAVVFFQVTLEGRPQRLITAKAAQFPDVTLGVYHASDGRFQSNSN